MDFFRAITAVLLLLEPVLSNIDIRRGGWLDRVVAYHKAMFVKDVQNLVPINIKASIVPAPKGYQDSKKWDYDSVLHLLVLIKGSEAAAPVHRALRRSLQPSRRLMMSMADSFKHFPSISKYSLNEFYYDVGSAEDYEEEATPVEDGVIVVSNPVEARLPSSQISIKLLKDILIQRAIAGRAMPSTPRSTIPWKPINHTQSHAAGDQATTVAGAAGGGGSSDGNSTAPADAAGAATQAAGTEGPAADGTEPGGGGATTGGAAPDAAPTAAPDAEPAA